MMDYNMINSVQNYPFNTKDLGVFKGFYSSEEYTYAKMYGLKTFLWILLPILGWFVLIILFIVFLVRTNPTRSFWIFEKGFVWKKGGNIIIILYSDIDELYYTKIAHYKNGTYQHTAHSFRVVKNGKILFKNIAWDNNEQDIEEKKSYLVRAFQAAEKEIQYFLIVRAKKEFERRGYVSLKDEEIIISKAFIRDKTGYDYTKDNINRVYYEDGEVIVEGTDYKNKLIGYEGHKLVISMDTNRILKFSLLEDLLGWKFK